MLNSKKIKLAYSSTKAAYFCNNAPNRVQIVDEIRKFVLHDQSGKNTFSHFLNKHKSFDSFSELMNPLKKLVNPDIEYIGYFDGSSLNNPGKVWLSE